MSKYGDVFPGKGQPENLLDQRPYSDDCSDEELSRMMGVPVDQIFEQQPYDEDTWDDEHRAIQDYIDEERSGK
jgi:hypothetical protein